MSQAVTEKGSVAGGGAAVQSTASDKPESIGRSILELERQQSQMELNLLQDIMIFN